MLKALFDRIKQAQAEGTFDALTEVWNRASVTRRLDMGVERYWMDKRAASANPLVKTGRKFYSQNDEDGITLEIMRRIGLTSGTFVEFGAGDGLENNTLILLMSGWKGVWLGADTMRVSIPPGSPKLRHSGAWVTAENCAALVAAELAALQSPQCDFLSIDLDGNDLYVAEQVLAGGAKPAVIVVEYNAKFPPPIRWAIKYDPKHQWAGDDYQGASLQSFADLFAGAGYRLVACNITGVNAYFVRNEFSAAFADVPADIATLFLPADYNWFVGQGHPPSPKTIERFL
jgi:hypothetical protein